MAQLRITARMYIAAPAGRLGLRGAAARRSATWPFALVGLRATSHTCDSLYAIAHIIHLIHNIMLHRVRVELSVRCGNVLPSGIGGRSVRSALLARLLTSSRSSGRRLLRGVHGCRVARARLWARNTIARPRLALHTFGGKRPLRCIQSLTGGVRLPVLLGIFGRHSWPIGNSPFPLAGQWNGPTPLLPIGRIRISSTLDLSRFSESLFSAAVSNYVDVRDSFRRLHELGLVSGNDNHVGDIGEYYVLRLLRRSDPDLKLSPKKNSGYDMETSGGTRISVKTMTPWSSRRKGTPIKYDLGHWGVLYAVLLDEALRPERMAAVPLDELRRREPFRENERRRQSGVRSYPLFQWWDWLKDYVVNLPDNL